MMKLDNQSIIQTLFFIALFIHKMYESALRIKTDTHMYAHIKHTQTHTFT